MGIPLNIRVRQLLLFLGLVGYPSIAHGVEPPVHVIAGGDVMFGRHTASGFRSCGGVKALKKIEHLLVGDVVLVNLETAASNRSLDELGVKRSKRGLTFQANTAELNGLRTSGVTAVSLANNHAEDCGDSAMLETLDLTAKANLFSAGVARDADPFKPTRWDIRDGVVALFSATTKRNRGSPIPHAKAQLAFKPFKEMGRFLPEIIKPYREDHPDELIIVSLHWGSEGAARPYPGQRRLAHQLIDAGANAVVGHHPHVLQPVEAYRKGLILYSTGNLVFDMGAPETRATALFDMAFTRDEQGQYRATGLVVHPLQISPSDGRPVPLEERKQFMTMLKQQSRRTARTLLKWRGPRLVWTPEKTAHQ